MSLRRRARRWADLDPWADHQAEIDELLARNDPTELERRFGGRLSFGTAGLRAEIGAGPMRMNAVVVHQAAAAVATWLPTSALVVIGFDARRGSDEFAHITANVLIEAGHEVELADEPLPTPIVAWRVANTDAAAGIVVTASHNPATDNGYKVYSSDGGQILPDDASRIETAMAEAALPDRIDVAPPAAGRLDPTATTGYLQAIARPSVSPSRRLRIVYTALHGVAGKTAVKALEAAGHEVLPVATQHEPNGNFPTAPFPNPEEPQALDLALASAAELDADLVMANDPDGDRLSVAAKRSGGWARLSGDEIGVLLGHKRLAETTGRRSVATTIVSSTLLASVATDAGATCHTTLTGFKWLARADALDATAPLVYAYEEALGYAVVPEIKDKDGISAAVLFAELTAELHADGQSLDSALEELYQKHGYHLTAQLTRRLDGTDQAGLAAAMTRLRAEPPQMLGSVAITAAHDLSSTPGPVYQHLPPADVVVYDVEHGRVVVRPSGTEPKLKLYLEARGSSADDARHRLATLADAAARLL